LSNSDFGPSTIPIRFKMKVERAGAYLTIIEVCRTESEAAVTKTKYTLDAQKNVGRAPDGSDIGLAKTARKCRHSSAGPADGRP